MFRALSCQNIAGSQTHSYRKIRIQYFRLVAWTVHVHNHYPLLLDQYVYEKNVSVSQSHPILQLLLLFLIMHTARCVNVLLFSITHYINESIGNVYEVRLSPNYSSHSSMAVWIKNHPSRELSHRTHNSPCCICRNPFY